MRKLAVLVFAVLTVLPAGSTALAATVVDFEGHPAFFSPGSAIPGIVVSPEGGIIDEASITLVTGLSFPPGTVATSGSNLLGNLFGTTLTITFATPVTEVSVQAVGSFASGAFGTITMEAFDGTISVGSVSSDPLAFGDSGAPEALLAIGPSAEFTALVFSSDIGGAS